MCARSVRRHPFKTNGFHMLCPRALIHQLCMVLSQKPGLNTQFELKRLTAQRDCRISLYLCCSSSAAAAAYFTQSRGWCAVIVVPSANGRCVLPKMNKNVSHENHKRAMKSQIIFQKLCGCLAAFCRNLNNNIDFLEPVRPYKAFCTLTVNTKATQHSTS